MSNDELAELVEWAEARLPGLVDEAYAAICARIDLYHDEEVVPRNDLHRSVAHNLRFMLSALADPHASHDFAAPRETGRRRAHQGAPLPEVLRAYRVGFALVWDRLVERARHHARPGSLDALLGAASMLWQLTDEHALAITEAYRATTAEMLTAQQRRRSALVETLLSGQVTDEGAPWEAGKILGLPLDGKLAVVVAETRGLAEESLPGVEQRLASHGLVSAWRLTSTMQCGIVSVPDEHNDMLLAVLRDAAGSRTGVSPLYRLLTETPCALHLARVALAAIPPGKAEVRMFSSSPLAALVAHDPDEGSRLVEQVLGAVLELPGEDRDGLLDTLQAVLDHGGSSDRAAQVLHCHPNTVRYRLRRIHELTGRSLSDPGSLAELATAAQALRWNPRARAGKRPSRPGPAAASRTAVDPGSRE